MIMREDLVEDRRKNAHLSLLVRAGHCGRRKVRATLVPVRNSFRYAEASVISLVILLNCIVAVIYIDVLINDVRSNETL